MQPYPGPGGKWQISTEGGTEPVWNPNGRELFYRSGNKMMAVDIATQPGFSAGKPRMLFEGPYRPTPVTNPNYDVSPDGQRFLMVKPSEQEQAAPTQINVVLNWFEELKRRVPVGCKMKKIVRWITRNYPQQIGFLRGRVWRLARLRARLRIKTFGTGKLSRRIQIR